MNYHFFQINVENKPWDQVEALTNKVIMSDSQAGIYGRFLSGLFQCEIRISYCESADKVSHVGGRYININ